MQKPAARRRLSAISHDVKRIARAIPGIWDYVRKPDHVDCSISLFSAASFDALRSVPAEYSLAVANNTSRPLFRKILIDIYGHDHPVHPEGHYAWFEKTFFLLPGRSCEITLMYDWLELVSFTVDGAEFPPDDRWRGNNNALGRYAVHAVLFDGSGHHFEDLFILQDLRP